MPLIMPGSLHGLRGHFVSYLLALAWPLPLVQDIAPHEDPATTLGTSAIEST
jgi:hypothetical protein